MKNKLSLIKILFIGIFSNSLFANAQGKKNFKELALFKPEIQKILLKKIEEKIQPEILACTPITYDNCINAWTLNVGTGSIGRTTCDATIEPGEDIACGYVEGVNQTVWLKFTAQNVPWHTVGVVEQNPSGNPCTNSCNGCYISSAVWESNNGGCPIGTNCKLISCQSSINGPRRQEHVLPNLVSGTVYYIQVMYKAGGACGEFGNFNIFVSNYHRDTISGLHVTNPRPYSICQNASATCNIASTQPTIPNILSNCPTTTDLPRDTLNTVVRQCYIVNTNANNYINFSNYVVSNCVGGNSDWRKGQNISWGYWTLLDNNCNKITCNYLGVGQSIVTLNNLSCFTDYRICIMYEIDSCIHFNHTFYSFGENTSIDCIPLPIELINFNASLCGEMVCLKWQTASEINNEKFVVEKSPNDGWNFVPIKTIPSKGNSTSGAFYETFDERPLDGVNFYRLKQIDFDGKFEYSKVIKVLNSKSLEIFPNPATDQIEFSSNVTKIELLAPDGKLINVNLESNKIKVSNLSRGIYFLHIREKDFRRKIILK